MRLLIIVDCYLPSTKSAAKHMHDLAVELVRVGHSISVLTPSDALSSLVECRVEDGIEVIRVRSGKIKGVGKVRRAFNELMLSSVVWRRGRKYLTSTSFDLILFYAPTIFFGPLVKRLRKLWSSPSYLILRDIFPQWALDAGVLKRGLVWRFFRFMETLQYDASDVIAVQCEADLNYFAQHFPNRQYRLDVLYNWASTEAQELLPTAYRSKLGLDGKTVFFYGGNIGLAQDMDNIVRLAVRFRKRADIHFLLVGEGSEVPRLQDKMTELRLSNITIHPAVPQDEYLSMLAQFDVGLITLDRRLTTQNVPGKIMGYMYFRIPVLASVNPGNNLIELITAASSGLVTLNGEDDQLYQNALLLADDFALRKRMGDNGFSLLKEKFAVEKAACQIIARFSPARAGQKIPGAEAKSGLAVNA